MPGFAAQPPLDFYSTVGLLLPVLFVSAVVELRLSVTSVQTEAEDEGEQINRLVGVVIAVVAMVVGESVCLLGLYQGHGSSNEALVAIYSVLGIGVVLALRFVDRLRWELVASDRETARRAWRVAVQILLILVLSGAWPFVLARL